MTFKCKICGGNLNIKQGERVTICEYCGVQQTIPSFIEPKIQEIYNRANNYLMHNEFDKAENLYNQILFENKEDADAYWNILMCHYGVTYVQDPKSGNYIPTCNRTLFMPIFKDENYINAVKYANAEQKDFYMQNAETIDKIQKGILSVSKHEKPFDIFISYKESDANGNRTKESIRAQELYEQLTSEGYKVFFSRITLEDKVGTEYEPYIYAALASSKVMITVSSSKENLDAVWVKNEWSRFLSFMQKDSSKTLIPLYFDMNQADLPEDFAHLPSYDMMVDGFEQELIRGIKKLIPLPVLLLERRKKLYKKLKIAGIVLVIIAVAGGIASVPWFMKLPDYNAAMQLYYDKNYPEATWAFDELGNYRNSQAMKNKTEQSWRRRLATTFSGSGAITPNGEAQILDIYMEQNVFAINEHGRILSLGGGVISNWLDYTYTDAFKAYHYVDAIYEDGYIDYAYASTKSYSGEDQPYDISTGKKEYDTAQWHNIVQIVSVEGVTVALRSDGKVLFQNNAEELSTNIEWINEVTSWEGVIQLLYVDSSDSSLLVGLRSDERLYCITNTKTQNADFDVSAFWEAVEIIKEMKSIKAVDICYDIKYNYQGSFVNVSAVTLNIAALTSDKKFITYIDGVYNESEAKDVVDLHFADDRLFMLNSNGTLSALDRNSVYLKDVIKIYSYGGSTGTAITRNGTVYQLYQSEQGLSPEQDTRVSKVAVYDEWVERMN